MKRLLNVHRGLGIVLACVCLVGCLSLTGCSTEIGNNGEWGIETSQSFLIVHRAAKTSDETATLNIEVPAIMEWIAKSKEPAPPADG